MTFVPSITKEQWLHNYDKYRKVVALEDQIQELRKKMQFTGLPELFGTELQQKAELQRLKQELMVECLKAETTSKYLDD